LTVPCWPGGTDGGVPGAGAAGVGDPPNRERTQATASENHPMHRR